MTWILDRISPPMVVIPIVALVLIGWIIVLDRTVNRKQYLEQNIADCRALNGTPVLHGSMRYMERCILGKDE